MSTNVKNQLREVMFNAWRFFRVTGECFADCLKKAWQVYKLAKEMKNSTVQFFYQKVNGEIRQAFGTMRDDVISDKIKGNDNRKKNEDMFTYWDCEKDSFRSFKKFNLIRIA
ncbi:MAG: SH3 beta-barrel fold-containing protein [Bacteroidales bacterium]|nr:SH3 beta-barrel fold-containing protein [Bacteroidales bacterium]